MQSWNKLIPIIIVIKLLSAQSISTIDTIRVDIGQQNLTLKPFIIDSSLHVFYSGRLLDGYRLNTISGDLELSEPSKFGGIYHVSYKYLKEKLQIQIGPLYKQFPILDSLLVKNQTEQNNLPPPPINSDLSNLATTGTVYRNLTVSPFGGSDFTGGLQLQLQGKLSNDLTVSGVLSDQSIPIQPEGTTQVLEEIDKVYLHVNHPLFQIMAGDIEYTLNSGKYLNVSRKLKGLRGELEINEWRAKATLASSQGRYHKLSFKGIDGIQGPYALTSESGNKDIIVLAGTEKVFLNGELVKRGENFDYTIDYSVGEITFTPRRLIDFDTDIYIEYEYSDYKYTRNIVSSAINRIIGDRGSIGFAWLKEKDQFQIDETLSIGIRDSLRNSGDEAVIISSAIKDEDGGYILQENIYIYSPENIGSEKYKVAFYNDNENGKYVRKISTDGKIYFEYMNEIQNNGIVDLYSPFQEWTNPINHDIFQIVGDYDLSKYSNIKLDISLSNLDKNTISTINDNDNLGIAYNLELQGDSIRINDDINFGYNIINWNRSEKFNEINKERDALFNREWNLESNSIGNESLFSSGINLGYNEYLRSFIDWSRYESVVGNREKLTANLKSKTKYIPLLSSYINQVLTNSSKFYQYNIEAQFLPGNFHPIINYKGEYKKGSHQFDLTKVGILFNNKKQNISAFISQRKDYEFAGHDSTKMDILKEGIYGELDINGKIGISWTTKIVFKKRVSDNFKTNESLDYAIGIANLRYANKTSPIKWDLLSKLEETYTESRAVVYDSVGTGLGSYRYDNEFNEYINDPNGAYISYTVLTGDRELSTHFNASQRFSVDFGKTKIKSLKNIDFRSDLKTEFRGNSFVLDKVIDPGLGDGDIINSKLNLRNEIDYNNSRKQRRIRSWSIISQNLIGTDPRGNDFRIQKEYSSEWREQIKKDITSLLNLKYRTFNNSSNFSNLRNRDVEGWWIEDNIKWKIDTKWQFAISAMGGNDSGFHNENNFNAYAYGLKLEGQHFIKSTTSIKIRTEIFNSNSKTDNSIIPPEALNGLPIGQSISINLQGQILLGKNLSLNTNANFIDNSRYNNFFTISGELRAYF